MKADDESVTIGIVTPQFTRLPSMARPCDPPGDIVGFRQLRGLSAVALKEMGLSQWNAVLWVYPGEWYNRIPAGLDVVDIFGTEERFVPGITDNDIRFGCLPYGFVREEDIPRFRERREEDWE